MAGFLTTHVLDTARGMPAADMAIDLIRLDEAGPVHLASVRTNADGRTDGPILPAETFQTGQYELIFHVGAYLRGLGGDIPEPAFLDMVPIRFGMAADDHYHVPLLVSPFGFSTYRGS